MIPFSVVGCEELVLLLISHGADIHATNMYGRNGLQECRKKQGKYAKDLCAKMEKAYALQESDVDI
jgi:ankyrin repeat protein